jgi:putative transposase
VGDIGARCKKRLKQLETENARLKKLLAETLLEAQVSREAPRRA